MASYTNSLRLTLPVTGTDDGTWGDTVNNGITTLIDTSIAGTAAITMTAADYTLTNNSGATDEARSMFITLGGTPGASFNVICPTKSKLYFVKNNTAFAQTFKTLAGTGISIPSSGAITVLYCDGTNVVDALNQLSSLSTTGQITSTKTGSAVDGQIYLNGATSNRIDFNANGANVPAYTTRSDGTKITLFPALSGSQADYAIGISAATQWYSIPVNSNSFFFKWFGGNVQVASLDGTGAFTSNTLTPANAVGASYGGTGLTAAGTSGNVLTSNGTTWTSTAPAASGVTAGKSIALAMIFGF